VPPDVAVGVLSNSWGSGEFDAYAGYDLDRRFDAVVISDRVGLRKPDPAIYRLAADKLGVPPHGHLVGLGVYRHRWTEVTDGAVGLSEAWRGIDRPDLLANLNAEFDRTTTPRTTVNPDGSGSAVVSAPAPGGRDSTGHRRAADPPTKRPQHRSDLGLTSRKVVRLASLAVIWAASPRGCALARTASGSCGQAGGGQWQQRRGPATVSANVKLIHRQI
jgi:hypothetical protein